MSAAAAGAGIGAVFGAFAKSKEIEANNKAAIKSFKATDAALTITQGINWKRAAEVTRLTASESNIALVEAKADITKGISKVAISRGEGVTAGISAARSVSNVLLKSSKAVEGVRTQTQNKITDMWAATEDANFKMQQQKISAYNNMRASLVTGTQATLAIIGAAIGGGGAGASIGSAASSFGSSGAASPSLVSSSTGTTNTFTPTHSDVGF